MRNQSWWDTTTKGIRCSSTMHRWLSSKSSPYWYRVWCKISEIKWKHRRVYSVNCKIARSKEYKLFCCCDQRKSIDQIAWVTNPNQKSTKVESERNRMQADLFRYHWECWPTLLSADQIRELERFLDRWNLDKSREYSKNSSSFILDFWNRKS